MNTTGNTWLEPAIPRPLDRGRLADEEETLFGLARNLVATLWRWRLLIFAIVAAGLAAAWFLLSTMPSTYVARTAVFFDFSRQTVVSDLPAEDVAPSAAMLNTEMEILTSRNLMSVVVEEFNLLEDPEFNPWLPEAPEDLPGIEAEAIPPREELHQTAVSILLNQVDVSLVPNSYVFTLTVETLSPEKSARIANGIADLFIRERSERRLDASEDAISWLERQTEALRQRVLEAESRVAEQRALAAPGGQSSLTSMAAQIASLRERVAETRVRADEIESIAEDIQTTWQSGKLVEAAELALTEVSGEIAREIQAAMTANAGPERVERLSPLLEEAQRQISESAAGMRSDIRTIGTEIEGLLQVYSERTSEAQELRDSEREAAASLAAYEAMLDRVKGRVAADALDPFWAEAVVISPAVPPQSAASPDRELILALAGVGSLAVASALALLLNALFPVVGSAREIERKTRAPVLAQLPIPVRARLPKLMRALRQNPSSPLAESLRALRIAIALGSRETAPRVLLLTSAEKDEGATPTGYLLAQSFVQTGRKVLLIDADPGRQSLFRKDAAAGPGLDAVLLGKTDPTKLIRRDDSSGLHILMAPDALRDGADLFAYGNERAVLETVASGYDVVVIIAPPVGTLPDARILARLADAVLVAVRRRHSRPDAVALTLEQLVSGGAPHVAMVLLSRTR